MYQNKAHNKRILLWKKQRSTDQISSVKMMSEGRNPPKQTITEKGGDISEE